MLKTILCRASLILVPVALLPAATWGQQMTVSPTITQILSSGAGVARNCLQSEYSTGLGVRVAIPVFTRWTVLQVAGRGYWIERGSDCVDGFPPPDGTYIQEDRINLQSQSFITTDVRLAAGLGELPVDVALGGGNAWHEGYDLPYVVLAAGLTLFNRPTAQVRLEAEYQWLRVTSDQVRRTYQNMDLIAEEPLGRVHQWSNAFAIGLALNLPL